MRALLSKAVGGPETLEMTEVDEPVAAAGREPVDIAPSA